MRISYWDVMSIVFLLIKTSMGILSMNYCIFSSRKCDGINRPRVVIIFMIIKCVGRCVSHIEGSI